MTPLRLAPCIGAYPRARVLLDDAGFAGERCRVAIQYAPMMRSDPSVAASGCDHLLSAVNTSPSVDDPRTKRVRHLYDRIAPMYDALEWIMELRHRRWRRELCQRLRPGRVLELGVGTGQNIPYYPPRCEVVGVDISSKMLARARRRALRLDSRVRLDLADAQALPYPEGSFGAVLTTFVFCSIPDPIVALREIHRVLVAGGQLLMLEHVLTHHRGLRSLMRWIDPIIARMWGAHLDRDTCELVRGAGFEDVLVIDRSLDIVKHIECRNPGRVSQGPQ